MCVELLMSVGLSKKEAEKYSADYVVKIKNTKEKKKPVSMLEQFGRVKNALTAIREERGMAVICICHSQIKTYANPLGADYDRHTLKLRDKNAELFMEWCDLIGFMHFSVFTNTSKQGFGQESTKAYGGSDRVLSCAPNAAYVSKNRYGITEDIDIPDPATGWAALMNAIKGQSGVRRVESGVDREAANSNS